MTSKESFPEPIDRGKEMVMTKKYYEGNDLWVVFKSIGAPLVEIHVREDDLE